MPDNLSRRTVIEIAAAAALIPAAAIRSAAQSAPARSLTPAQLRTTEMLVDRILPADDLGPGALEIGAANYIDVQMAGYLAPQKDAFLAGLNALDAFALRTQNAPFADLTAEKRDAVLLAVTAEDGAQDLRNFFNLARTYTLQGTFGDPHYGGNLGGKGWDIIRYPGPRAATSPDMQRLDKPPEPYRRSAWGMQ